MVYIKPQCFGIEIIIFMDWDKNIYVVGMHILNQYLE